VLRLQREGIEPRRFRAVRAPVLMLHGADDPHPGRATFELLRRVVPTIEYEELAGCRHEPWREPAGRERCLASLLAWLDRAGTR
jgi:alpha-beta hydrolase superfamily lysophospholipase